MKLARLAVETGIFPLYEINQGKLNISINLPKRKSIKDYLVVQNRFHHLTDDDINEIQSWVDRRYCELMT